MPTDYNNDSNLILGTDSNDVIRAHGGDDTVFGGQGYDTIDGGSGDDVLIGGDSVEGTYSAGEHFYGHDWIRGGDGNDLIAAGTYYHDPDYDIGLGAPMDANNLVDFGGQQGFVEANIQSSVNCLGGSALWGQGGSDRILGGDGADRIGGGSGNDYISAFFGDDTVYGGSGSDTVFGGSGDDLLFGGAGNDSVFGGAGSDTIWGGAGDDILRPGNENGRGGEPSHSSDTFGFADQHGNDIILGFNSDSDILDFSELHAFSSLSDVYAATEVVTPTSVDGSRYSYALLIHTDSGDSIEIELAHAVDISELHIVI